MDRFGLFGTLRAAPGRGHELAGHLLRAADLLAANGDCLLYAVATTGDADEVAVTEVWTTEAAHAASLDDEAVRALIAEARPLVAGLGGQTRLTVLGGKGLPATP